MDYLALYLFFIASIATFRPSKYWPVNITGFWWLAGTWKAVLFSISGLIILCLAHGFALGLLMSLGMLMLLFSAVIFFANCKPLFSWSVLIMFHLACLSGIFLNL